MTQVVPVTSASDFSDLRLEKTVNGNVVSPWWTFPWKQPGVTAPQQWNSKYHEISRASIGAFASLLGIGRSDVLVTEKIVDGERWWRLGTKHTCELPRPKHLFEARNKRETLKSGPPAIDI